MPFQRRTLNIGEVQIGNQITRDGEVIAQHSSTGD